MAEGRKIMVFTDWYEPGFKAGGPIRSCVNFAENMQGAYEVFVFTTDRDLNADAPYTGIRVDEWRRNEKGIRVYYCSPAGLTWSTIRRQLRELRPDFIYLNSMFSVRFTLFPLLMSRFSGQDGRVVLSPRGMLKDSAVRFKSRKKKVFLNSFRWLGFSRRVVFLASDETEIKDVRHYFGPAARVVLIPNFPARLSAAPAVLEKKPGEVSLIFVGRIHPIKNPDVLLRVLKEVRATVRLTLVGSLEDKTFWAGCEALIRELPANITIHYAGEIPNDQLPAVTAGHHLFVLPTRGENFGHAIFEALTLGKPVLISDQTPWRDLAPVKAGWDLPLHPPEGFRVAIEQAAAFDQQEYTAWSLGARNFVERYLERLNLKEEYLKLFS